MTQENGKEERMGEEKKHCCRRCGNKLCRDQLDSVEVNKSSYLLCAKCVGTFYSRFQTFMAGGEAMTTKPEELKADKCIECVHWFCMRLGATHTCATCTTDDNDETKNFLARRIPAKDEGEIPTLTPTTTRLRKPHLPEEE